MLRQTALAGAALAGLRGFHARGDDSVVLPFANGERRLVKFPQKRPLIVLTHRPPHFLRPIPFVQYSAHGGREDISAGREGSGEDSAVAVSG
jgi:hypothetical protein